MFLLVTHAIYIIIVLTVIVHSYITSTSLHPGLSRAKSNGTRRCSAVRRYCLIKSPVTWCAGWARATHVDFMPGMPLNTFDSLSVYVWNNRRYAKHHPDKVYEGNIQNLAGWIAGFKSFSGRLQMSRWSLLIFRSGAAVAEWLSSWLA